MIGLGSRQQHVLLQHIRVARSSVTRTERERLHHGFDKEQVRQLSAGLQRRLPDPPYSKAVSGSELRIAAAHFSLDDQGVDLVSPERSGMYSQVPGRSPTKRDTRTSCGIGGGPGVSPIDVSIRLRLVFVSKAVTAPVRAKIHMWTARACEGC